MSHAATETTGDAWALADRLVQAQVEARLLGHRAEPTRLGRYRIERGLGEGAMGRLLLAFDPDLQRPVALKLITPARAGSVEARRRIVREARAMAQLSDPHVAQVYEVGEADGQLFVAMEHIDGQDLRAWLDERARPWTEVLAVFRQAGSGLAAAHDKGIVHRDFKPDNVMLERDGRARVIDFGLAFPGALAPGDPVDDGGAVELTQTGAVMGTPAYVAPEQWGGIADARSDQYAFCVALFEALVGRRPFEGDTAEAIREAQRQRPRWSGAVPRWVRRVVERGLAPDPDARWPDLRALVRALEPGRRRRRHAALGAGAIVLAALGVALRPAADPCRDAGEEIEAIWGQGPREAIERAAAGVDARWAHDTAPRLIASLDAYRDAWRDTARGMCAAARREPAHDDDASAGCMEESRRRLAELVDEASEPEPARFVGALAQAELLPGPRACPEAPATVHARGADADEPSRRAVVDSERALGRSLVPGDAASFGAARDDALQITATAIDRTRARGYAPLQARAHWLAGRVQLVEGEPKAAERELRRALVFAQRARDAALSAAIVTELVYAVSRDRERFGEAEDLADQAAGMIAGLGDPPLLRARLLAHRASALAHAARGDHDEAVRLHEQAVEILREQLGPAHPLVIVELGNLGAALNYADRPADAEARLQEALAAGREAWGDEHPRQALLLGTLGLARMRQGDAAGAEQHLRRSLALREATLGADHAQVDDARYNLASALRRRDRHADALPLLERGLQGSLARLGPDDARLGPWWVATGESALAVGERSRAREALASALRLFERTGASAADYARVRLALARAWTVDDPARARVLAEQALVDATLAGASRRVAEIESFLAGEPSPAH